jgi:hypothetical protein
VENEQWENRKGLWGDGQTGSGTLNKDLKLSMKSARWLPKLGEKVAIFAIVSSPS